MTQLTARVSRACRVAVHAATLVTAASCASVPVGAGGGGSSAYGARDERRLVGSFADVRAIGLSRRYVYTATASGIGVYDRLFNAWLPPLARDGGLTDGQITFMTGDPVEDAVWVGVPGAILMYRPQNEQLQRTMIVGVPELIVFDRAPSGDAYVRAGGQWTRVSRIGTTSFVSGPPPNDKLIVPKNLNDVYARYPGLRSGSPLLFRNQQSDRSLRAYQVVAGAYADDTPGDVWLGTNGDGLYKLDGATQQATPLRYGLIEFGVGALALAADGVWTAGLGNSQLRGGLSFASNDLQRWRWIDGTITVPMQGMRATSMALRGSVAWIGTDRGVVRAELNRGEAMSIWRSLDGLPDDRVLAVDARPDGAWVGTVRGLVFIADSSDTRNPRARGVGTRLLENTTVHALQSIGDTLWIGTSSGLLALPPSGTLSRPLGAEPALRRRINALAWSDTLLLAATDDGVLALNPKGGREPARITALDVAQVGQVTRMAMDDRTIVVAGTDGVLVYQRSGGVRVLRAPADFEAPALDVVLSRDWMWIATPAGLLRFRRASDGGLP